MSSLINNQQKINDIIFAKRNKNYGAYAIRSNYGSTLLKSLAIMAFGFTSIMGTAFYYSNMNQKTAEESVIPILQDSAMVVTFNLKKEDAPLSEKPKEPETQPKQKTNTEKGFATKIEDSVTVVNSTTATIPFNTSVATTSGSATNEGSDNAGGTNSVASSGSVSTSEGTETKQPYDVDNNPEFEGGLKALYKFLGSKLKYPPLAYEEKKGGTVYVKFVVDENGKVGNLKLLNTIGYGMDEEALRVVSLIPNFKTPAKIKGKPVKVYYQLPVKYSINF